MKMLHVFLSVLFALSTHMLMTDDRVYYNELKALKKAPETEMMFDKDAHAALGGIQRDIFTHKNLTFFQRFVRSMFIMYDVVIVTPETMPRLYEYVDGICKKAKITTPTVFITRQNGFFNAFAAKLLMSSGGIVIGQKLLKEVSDDALEGIVAHEIGHIKHNHVNKLLALEIMKTAILIALVNTLDLKPNLQPSDRFDKGLMKICKYFGKRQCLSLSVSLLFALLINKRFEKEADAFAYEANGKGKGLIEFFELLIEKDELREEDFVTVYKLLQKNKSDLSLLDYYILVMRYYLARTGQSIVNVYKKIYHETFIGAHPSSEARIATIKEYLATQA